MRFGLLGPLAVADEAGEPIAVPAAKQRAVLAALLLHAGHVVSLDRLIEIIWDEHPPASAQVTLVNYVARLRKALGPDGGRVRTRPGGYSIEVHPDELDTLRLAGLERAAAAAARAGDWAEARRAAGEALGLWRGEPLQDVASPSLVRDEAPALAEARLRLHEAAVDAELCLGEHEGAAARLAPLIRDNPLRERLYLCLAVALYGAGRRAEALEVYHRARRVVRRELGVDPAAELQQLHQDILDAVPAAVLAARLTGAPPPPSAAPAEPAPAAGPGGPRQLPGPPRHFTGRAAELDTLTELLDPVGATADTLPIAAIVGGAGVGKTTLAVHWAHRLADRFPDGHLHVDLRGFDPGGAATPPGYVLRGFLEALGVRPGRLPSTVEAQTGLYRSLLAGKRMLILLDNARDAEQVRPLLPGSPSCVVLVTSRNQLAGLVTREGAQPVTLGLLADPEARELLGRRLGARRADEEAEALAELARLCAGLPLALSVAAARLALNPDLPIAKLTARLHDMRDRLAALDAGDPDSDVRAVFSWSYQQLSDPAARLFRLLSLHPGPDISSAAAACLPGLSAPEAHESLAELAEANLVTEHLPGRFLFHDLLRAYAADLALDEEEPGDRTAATTRMLDHYLHSALSCSAALNPNRDQISPDEPGPGVTVYQPDGLDDALAWFTAEHAVLLAVIARAGADGFDVHAWQTGWACSTYFNKRSYWHDWLESQNSMLAAGLRLGDLDVQARAHRNIGLALHRFEQGEEALAHVHQAREIHGALGYHIGHASAHESLAMIHGEHGRPAEAVQWSAGALEIYRLAGHRPGEASALNSLGWFETMLGEYDSALEHCRQSIEIFRQAQDPPHEAHSWDSLGYIHQQLGDHAQAASCYRHAMELFRSGGVRYYVADSAVKLGDCRAACGEHEAARAAWAEALAIFEELGYAGAAQVRAKLAV